MAVLLCWNLLCDCLSKRQIRIVLWVRYAGQGIVISLYMCTYSVFVSVISINEYLIVEVSSCFVSVVDVGLMWRHCVGCHQSVSTASHLWCRYNSCIQWTGHVQHGSSYICRCRGSIQAHVTVRLHVYLYQHFALIFSHFWTYKYMDWLCIAILVKHLSLRYD